MQPFGIPKNPKMTVQTQKKPPVQRYPVPYGVPSKPTSTGPTPQKSTNPFAEDYTTDFFRPPNGLDENEAPLQTSEGLGSYGVQQQGYGFEETPADLIRGGSSKINENNHEDLPSEDQNTLHKHHIGIESNVPQHSQNKNISPPVNIQKRIGSPDKKTNRTRDDDEYVRMASADEEEYGPEQEDEPEFKSNQQGNRIQRPNNQVRENEEFRVYEEEQGQKTHINFNKSPNVNEIVDANIMLKVKRLELELAKEKQRADFFESEQGKLIDENAELRRRTEELNARVDLAKKYDSSDKLVKKEEEVERLRIELNRLSEENRIYESHARRVLEENSEYKRESEILISSLQEEKRRLQNEIHSLKRDLENRVSSKIENVHERNRILEEQLAELRQQVQILTDQLLLKTNTQQKMVDVSGEIQSLVSNLSKATIPSHSAGLKSQHMQTSPTKFYSDYSQGTEIETQTHEILQESQQSQTLPIAFQNEPREQSSIQSQTHAPESFSQHIQTSPSKFPPTQVQTQNAYTSPAKFMNPGEKRSPEKPLPKPIPRTGPLMTSPGHGSENIQIEEKNVSVTTGEDTFPHLRTEVSVETPNETIERPNEQMQENAQLIHEVQSEEKPQMFKPPTLHPPNHHLERPPQTQINKTSPGLPNEHENISGSSGLMAPPKYKIPHRTVPKKPVGGLKPLSQNPQLFSDDIQQKTIENSFKTSPTLGNENQYLETTQSHHQFTPEMPTYQIQKEEPVHHFNPTSAQEPIHSHSDQNPPKLSHSEDHPPIGHTHVNQNELPQSSMEIHQKPTVSGQTFPIVNRPPLFNAHHIKPKTHKIGKNPFSESTEGTSGDFNINEGSTEIKTEKVSELPRQIVQQTKMIPQRNSVQESHKVFHQAQEEISSEAAENFFDQLGKGPNQQTEARGTNPYMNQNEVQNTQSDICNWGQGQNVQQKSFVNEITDVNVESRGIETAKSQIGKAVPVKKKKGALPTNMFD